MGNGTGAPGFGGTHRRARFWGTNPRGPKLRRNLPPGANGGGKPGPARNSPESTEQWVAVLDPLLQRIGLRLCELAGRDSSVQLIHLGPLKR